MKAPVPPTTATLKRQHGRALADLRKASADFSPDSDRRFRELKAKADLLFSQIYWREQSDAS